MTKLFMPSVLRDRLEALVREGYPHETCGLLIGRQDGFLVKVQGVLSARNLNTSRAEDRYELDPDDFVAADLKARDAGLEIVGIWHSHPEHPALPSETDRAAAWRGWSYVIASVNRESVSEVRSWRLNGDQFEEETILS